MLPRIQERPPDRLADDDIQALIQMPEPHGFIARFGGTGLRWDEMSRAQSTDIQNGVLVVSQTETGRRFRRSYEPSFETAWGN